MMSTQTRTGAYLKRMANGGHFKQKLGEASLALAECFCKADATNQRKMGTHLAEQMYEVLTDVYGWEHKSASEAVSLLHFSFLNAEEHTP